VIQRLVMPMLGNDPDESAIAAALPEISTCMTTIAALRGNNTYLAGNQLSLADLHFAPIYDYFKNTPESGPILDKTPSLGDWWNEMSGRASLQKTPPLPG
jgi:glutathione S-transferase